MSGMKVFVERKGRKRELAGWRKWAVAIVVLPVVALVVAVAVVFAFGLALTIGAVVLVAVAALVVLAGIVLMFGRRVTDPPSEQSRRNRNRLSAGGF